jgi:hypothetical protein
MLFVEFSKLVARIGNEFVVLLIRINKLCLKIDLKAHSHIDGIPTLSNA